MAELGATMSAEEFGLHMQLEVERSRGQEAPADAEMQALFEG